MGVDSIISRIQADTAIEINRIRAEAQAEVERINREGVKKGEEQYQSIITAGRKKINQKYAEERSRMMIAYRNRVRGEKEAIIAECFNLASLELKSIRNSENYPHILKRLILDGIKIIQSDSVISDTIIISVDEQDRNLAFTFLEELKHKGVKATISADFIRTAGGGIITDSHGIRVDNTIESRIERNYNNLLTQIADILFTMESD